jgi:hypothetical protein
MKFENVGDMRTSIRVWVIIEGSTCTPALDR